MLKPRDYRRELANEHSRARSRHQDPARRARDADSLVQHPGGPPVSGKPTAASRDPAAGWSAGPGTALPDGADQAGGFPGALHRYPAAGPRGLATVAPDATDAGSPPRMRP